MIRSTLEELLKLPAAQRAELALALWGSLSESEGAAGLALTPEQEAELDRRLAEYLAHPETSLPWEEVRRKLIGGA